tara:strand:+ start:1073 stop:1462 length:390 start_codon:yes stop_codon:yes gene_type:complete
VAEVIVHPDQVKPGMLLENMGRGTTVRVLYVKHIDCACKSIGDYEGCACQNDELNVPKVPFIQFEYPGRNPRTGGIKLYENGDCVVWDGKYNFTTSDSTGIWDFLSEDIEREYNEENEKSERSKQDNGL